MEAIVKSRWKLGLLFTKKNIKLAEIEEKNDMIRNEKAEVERLDKIRAFLDPIASRLFNPPYNFVTDHLVR